MSTPVKSVFSAAGASSAFVLRNLWQGRKVRPFAAARYGAFVVEPLAARTFAAAGDLYASLNEGRRFGLQTSLLLRLLGSRFCLVARDPERDEVVALTLFYFNARDSAEGTVHASYNGLRESAQGLGLGTFMLRHALANYARSGLAGASSRVSLNNIPALKTNEKAGFVPVETYFDPWMGEDRHYLVCDLGRYKESADDSQRTSCK